MSRAEDIFNTIIDDGASAINEFILQRQAEELFLDFKRSADDGSGNRLHQNDRNNLTRAISGFGNSDGGVIVWGIDCSPGEDYADVAHTHRPIQDVKRFVSWLEGAVSGCTLPPHPGIRHHPIEADESENGFVATLIPKSNHAPHQVVRNQQYLIRAGSSFVPTPHGVLAGMFGRRPQPNIFETYITTPAEVQIDERVKCEIGFLIANNEPGIASDLFMQLKTISFLGDNCVLKLQLSDQDNWKGQFSFNIMISAISKPDVRLPIEMHLQPFQIEALIGPPFTKRLSIRGICGSGQSPPRIFELSNSAEMVEELYNKFIEKYKKGTLTESDMQNFVGDVFGIKRDDR